MKDFCEGKISTEEFWLIYKSDKIIQQIILNDKKLPKGFSTYLHGGKLLEGNNLNGLYEKSCFFTIVNNYFLRRNISISSFNKEFNLYEFLLIIQPPWLDIQEEFFLEILKSAPQGITKNDSIKWCKTKIKELFKYEDKPPKWLQNPEWPIINGKPLIFKYQSDDVNDYTISKINYYFFNPENGEEVVVEQFD